MDEIVALEQQRLVGRHSERIGEAVPDIQPSPMAAAAEAAERVDCDLGLLRRDADDVEAALAQQKIDIRAAGLALPTLDDAGKLDAGYRRKQPNRRLAER